MFSYICIFAAKTNIIQQQLCYYYKFIELMTVVTVDDNVMDIM